MKTTLFALALAMISVSAFAQIQRGTSTIGGSVSGSHQSYETDDHYESKTTSFSFQPGYGYFVAKNFCVGLDLNLSVSYSKAKYPASAFPDVDGTTRALGLGPWMRYYVALNDRFYFFPYAFYTWGRTTYESKFKGDSNPDDDKGKYHGRTVGTGVGLSYFINPSIAADLTIGYSHYSRKQLFNDPVSNIPRTSIDKTNTLGFNVGLRLFLRRD